MYAQVLILLVIWQFASKACMIVIYSSLWKHFVCHLLQSSTARMEQLRLGSLEAPGQYVARKYALSWPQPIMHAWIAAKYLRRKR